MDRRRRLVTTLRRVLDTVASSIVEQVVQGVTQNLRRLENVATDLRREIHQLKQQLDQVAATLPKSRNAKPCKVPGCGRPHVARGYCKDHYRQYSYHLKKIAEAKAQGKRYLRPKPGEKRPGRPPRVPLA